MECPLGLVASIGTGKCKIVFIYMWSPLASSPQLPESLTFVMGIERDDVPNHKQGVYEKLFPHY